MPFTNNTNFRRFLLTIEKKVNGVTDTASTVTVSLLNAIPNTVYGQITQQQLARLNEQDYLARLNAFYTYLENTYSYFQRTLVPANGIGAASGTDAVLCPIATPQNKQVVFRTNLYSTGNYNGQPGARSRLSYNNEVLFVDTAGQAPAQVTFDNVGQTVTITPLFNIYSSGVQSSRLQIERNNVTIQDTPLTIGVEDFVLALDDDFDYTITVHVTIN